jgi:hypothetical protein
MRISLVQPATLSRAWPIPGASAPEIMDTVIGNRFIARFSWICLEPSQLSGSC